MSPATTAAHEFGHAASYERDSKKDESERVDRTKGSDSDYGSKEEKRNITQTEQRAAKRHGEIEKGQITRKNHKLKGVYPLTSISFEEMSEECKKVNGIL